MSGSVGARLCAIGVGHSDKWSVILRGSTHHLVYSLEKPITLLDFEYLLNTKGCTGKEVENNSTYFLSQTWWKVR